MVTQNSTSGFLARLVKIFGLNKKTQTKGSKIVYEGFISGYQYHKGLQMEHMFGPGTIFSLKHEPENPFDDDAVALYFDDARIGFIPPTNNVEILKRIRNGEPLQARVSRFEPESDPWERVYVEVLQEEPA